MTYQIKETETGHFAVMEMWPVEIARFSSPTHARMFVDRVLCSEPDARCRDAGGIEPAEARFDPKASLNGFAREVMEETEARDAKPMSGPDQIATHGAAPPVSVKDAPEQDWERALSRVAAGEKCTSVAEDMGLPFGSLRARWAARSKAASRAAEPEVAENGHDTRSPPASGLMAALPVKHRGPLPSRVEFLGTAADVADDEAEDVSGRPDRIARREAVWTDEIDMALIEAGDDEERLWKIAQETGASIERCKRRQTSLMEGIAREIGR